MNYKEYHPDWRDIIRPDILRRDKYVCTQCGIRHKTYIMYISVGGWQYIERSEYDEYKRVGIRVAKVILQVAHLDNNKLNNGYNNLLSLCLSCHHKRDTEHKRIMRKAKKRERDDEVSPNQLNIIWKESDATVTMNNNTI